MAEWDGTERMQQGHEVNILSARLQSLHEDVGEMKSALRELTSAITKLALIEERQSQTQMAQERAFTAIKKVEDGLAAIEKLIPPNFSERLTALEQKSPMNDMTNKWVWHGVTALVAGFLVYIIDHFKKGH